MEGLDIKALGSEPCYYEADCMILLHFHREQGERGWQYSFQVRKERKWEFIIFRVSAKSNVGRDWTDMRG